MAKENDDQLREVEEILDKKVKDHKIYYLIKWKGMKEKYNTWVKYKYLETKNAQLIQQFERKLEKMNLNSKYQQVPQQKTKGQTTEEIDIGSYGSFKYNDKPSKILFVDLIRSVGDKIELNCTIEWKKRKNGGKPKNSVYTNILLKHKCPNLLLDYYESKIKNIYNQQINLQNYE